MSSSLFNLLLPTVKQTSSDLFSPMSMVTRPKDGSLLCSAFPVAGCTSKSCITTAPRALPEDSTEPSLCWAHLASFGLMLVSTLSRWQGPGWPQSEVHLHWVQGHSTQTSCQYRSSWKNNRLYQEHGQQVTRRPSPSDHGRWGIAHLDTLSYWKTQQLTSDPRSSAGNHPHSQSRSAGV